MFVFIMVAELTFLEYLVLFGYLFLPILIFGVLTFVSIILSNRMGGKNKLIVFFVRLILVGVLIFALFYYFYYLMNVLFVG
jgi:hypothetical protein